MTYFGSLGIDIFAAENTSEASGFSALGLDTGLFVTQLATFLLVYLVLRKFIFGRIVDLLHKRQRTIEEGLKLTEEAKTAKAKFEEEVSQIRSKARTQADSVVADSKAQASQIIKSAQEQASKQAQGIVDQAHQRIEEDKARAKRQLEKELVDLVVEATEAVSKEKITSDKDKRLIQEALHR